MPPLSVVLALENEGTWTEIESCLRELPVRITAQHRDLARLEPLLERIARVQPDVALVEARRGTEWFEGAVRRIRAAAPECLVIAAGTELDIEHVLDLLRAGAHEYVYSPFRAGLQKALERRRRDLSRRAAEAQGKILGVLSAKGGCGGTTVACHVAGELAQQGRRVLLMDLDGEAAAIRFLLKIESCYSILDALDNYERLDLSYWKALISSGPAGMDVLPAHEGEGDSLRFEPARLREVLAFARNHYDWIVLDLGRGLNAASSAALENASSIALVTSTDLCAVHHAQRLVGTMKGRGCDPQSIRLVVNRAPKDSVIGADELRQIVGVEQVDGIPDSPAEMQICAMERRLLPRNGKLGQRLAHLAGDLTGAQPARAPASAGLKIRLIFRREAKATS